MVLFVEKSFHSISSTEEELHDNNDVTSLFDDTIHYVGQIFDTSQDAKIFYRKYAKCVGFEVRIKTNRKHVNSKDFCFRLY